MDHNHGKFSFEPRPIVWNFKADLRRSQTTEYLAYYLLQNYGSSAEIKGFVDKYDFYIFPVVNPDGMSILIQF